MRRFLVLLYSLLCYAFFFVTFLAAVGFVSGIGLVLKTIDDGAIIPLFEAVAINLALMSVFAIQHSVMARKGFKAWWTCFVPQEMERSTYVLFATAALALLIWQWRPMPMSIWVVSNPALAGLITGVSLLGWLIVLTSTFLINHFELFGVSQATRHFVGSKPPEPMFRTPLFYKMVRHPIYLGFVIAFWSAPVMSLGHALFAAVTTAYILVGIALEERDLIDLFGDQYRAYRSEVSMLFPFRFGRAGRAVTPQSRQPRSAMPGE